MIENIREKVIRCSSPGTDQYDRKYPVKLTLKNGDIFLATSSTPSLQLTNLFQTSILF
jgi:hypothetical protein